MTAPKAAGGRYLVLPLLLLLLVALMSARAPAQAEPEACPEGIDVTAMGAKQPVLLVHGFQSDEDTWGPDPAPDPAPDADPKPNRPSFRDAMEATGSFVQSFDYGPFAKEWVDHRDIGPRLAHAIDCMYQASLTPETGSPGPGKVIVVAHSMGGLAVRCALAPSCGHRPGMESKVGLLITIGTPNLGSQLRVGPVTSFAETALAYGALGTICLVRGRIPSAVPYASMCQALRDFGTSHAAIAMTPGSRELRALPPVPDGVPVRALAGRFLMSFPTFRRSGLIDAGDGAVDVSSALNGATSDSLGRAVVIDCGVASLSSLPRCSHRSETSNADFINDVVGTVNKYIASGVARAEAEAVRAAEEKSKAGILPAPVGPTLRVPASKTGFPFTVRAIAAALLPTLNDDPAPAGKLYIALAVQVRGTLTDRGTEAPPADVFVVLWPEPDCHTIFGDKYGCSYAQMKFLSDYIPSDAEEFTAPPEFRSDVVIPPGEGYDVAFYGLVPDDVKLSQARLVLSFEFGMGQYLPLANLPAG
jgi:pimeloyl-ACP methyl ester carboxylesterase